MVFSETWLRPESTMDNFLIIDGFLFYRKDRANGRSRGGGILVYVKDTLKSCRRPDLEAKDLECVTVDLITRFGNRFILFCCYRPPDQSVEVFFEALSTVLSMAESEPAIITVLGDFNAKHPSWDADSNINSSGTRMYRLLLDFSLSQIVTSPTRVSSDGSCTSTIDLVCTTRPDLIRDLKVSDPISDHCCVSAHFHDLSLGRSDRNMISTQRSKHIVPDFSVVDWASVQKALYNSYLLEAIQGTSDVNIAWQTWKSVVMTVLSRHIPVRVVVHHPKNKSWMTAELYKMSKKSNVFSKLLCDRDHLMTGPLTNSFAISAQGYTVRQKTITSLA